MIIVMDAKKKNIVIVAGATAVGKSEFAIELARRLDGEVVNADAMQLYRGLDIGTAKVPPNERGGIPHHLFDIAEVDEYVDVFRYLALAETAIEEITARGKMPIFCGGTGYYLKSLVYGLDDLPGDRELRLELDARYNSPEGEAELRALMSEQDPVDYERFGSNLRKLIRAWEVFLLTNRPMVDYLSDTPREPRYHAKMLHLVRPREELRERIAVRTHLMLENGWIEETRQWVARGFLETPTARQAIGYALIAKHLQGELTREEVAEQIVTRTWQYARRQLTWFNGQHPERIDIPADTDPEEVLKLL